jgi:Regulator of ribonuclease activity B
MNINIQEQIDGHFRRNEELKEALRDKGVKLHERRSVELHFWAFSQKDAAMLAQALYEEGLLVLVLAPPPSGESEWNIEAGLQDSVENLTSLLNVKRFVELAAKFNALYDGWGTVV